MCRKNVRIIFESEVEHGCDNRGQGLFKRLSKRPFEELEENSKSPSQ